MARVLSLPILSTTIFLAGLIIIMSSIDTVSAVYPIYRPPTYFTCVYPFSVYPYSGYNCLYPYSVNPYPYPYPSPYPYPYPYPSPYPYPLR